MMLLAIHIVAIGSVVGATAYIAYYLGKKDGLNYFEKKQGKNGDIKLSVDFEKTQAYLWLTQNAHKYGFYLQYPKNNKSGIMFEPWHWYFKE